MKEHAADEDSVGVDVDPKERYSLSISIYAQDYTPCPTDSSLLGYHFAGDAGKENE